MNMRAKERVCEMMILGVDSFSDQKITDHNTLSPSSRKTEESMPRRSNRRGQNRNRLKKEGDDEFSYPSWHNKICTKRVDLTVITEEVQKRQSREEVDRQSRSNEHHWEVFPNHGKPINPDRQCRWNALGVQDYTPSFNKKWISIESICIIGYDKKILSRDVSPAWHASYMT